MRRDPAETPAVLAEVSGRELQNTASTCPNSVELAQRGGIKAMKVLGHSIASDARAGP